MSSCGVVVQAIGAQPLQRTNVIHAILLEEGSVFSAGPLPAASSLATLQRQSTLEFKSVSVFQFAFNLSTLHSLDPIARHGFNWKAHTRQRMRHAVL
jgi:hypothetical protein